MSAVIIYGLSLFLTLWSHDWPCRNFHLHGECEAGENCKYSHEELTDETRPLLDVVRPLALFDQVISEWSSTDITYQSHVLFL